MSTLTCAVTGLVALLSGAAPQPHRVIAPGTPPLTLEIDAAYRALTAIEFPIENLTNATRHVFVITDARHVAQRAIVVQYELVKEGSDFRFQFSPTPPQTFGDQTYRFTSFIYDDERAAREAPQREAGQTRALLRANGITPPVRWKSARLARVADMKGLREVIIFYMENADSDPAADLGENGYASLTAAEAARLLERLRAAVRPVAG